MLLGMHIVLHPAGPVHRLAQPFLQGKGESLALKGELKKAVYSGRGGVMRVVGSAGEKPLEASYLFRFYGFAVSTSSCA